MVMKKLWSGTEVSHEGEFFQFNGALQQPTPTQPIKIRIGGSSAPALRRAARHDGWMGEPMSKNKLIETVKILENLRAEQKKSEPMDLFFTLMEMPTREIYNELDSMGLSNRVAITPWKRERWLRQGENPEQIEVKKLALIRFAQDVIDI
jgi:alkanesulfonate monooxygenase SsuD/methylene tetrahydromethanopterin reductase-like flavin-dependent oxidoreductase (luciferase family)